MCSNGNVDLTVSSNDVDLRNMRVCDDKEEFIKVLEEGLERISSKFLSLSCKKKKIYYLVILVIVLVKLRLNSENLKKIEL